MAAAPNSNSTVVEARSRCAKRARTEVADNWRDWANLTAGPAGLIAEELLADDVAGYLRFRTVCGSWRRCTPSPHEHDGLDRRFHPRRWIMLPEVFAARISRRDFLNVYTGERIRVDLPMLRFQFVIGPTSEGLIVLCQKGTGIVRLLNPLTKQLVTLPGAPSLLSPMKSPYSKRWKPSTGLSKLKKLEGFSAGLADSSTIALHFGDHELQLAVAKPNGERWSLGEPSYCITAPAYYIISALSFANRFYCVDSYSIKVVDVTDAGQRPQLAMVKVDEDFRNQCAVNLIDNDGELILFTRRGITESYDVRRVDLDGGEMESMCGLRGRAVFVCDKGAGRGRSLSVHAGLSSSIMADAIYRCRSDRYTKMVERIDVFLVATGHWIQHNLSILPGSIVDYLSRYVCRSPDIVVPAPLCRGVRAVTATSPRKRKEKRKRKTNSQVIGNEWVN